MSTDYSRLADDAEAGADEVGIVQPDPPPKDLSSWWNDLSYQDCALCIPKLQEYGSKDLVAIGEDLARLMQWEDAPPRVQAELGVAFYLRGKLARVMEAYSHQQLSSDDTWHDITVYSMMARRIREVGEWR